MVSPLPSLRRLVLLGLPVDAVTMPEAIALIDEAVVKRKPFLISTPNMSFFTNARKDALFRASLFASDLSLADGAPVVALASLMGSPLGPRLAGSDLFEALRERTPHGGKPIKVFFFGGPEGAAEAAHHHLNASAKGLRSVGFLYPGFRNIEDMSDDATIAAINASGADLLVVALGAVKGQHWLMRNREKLTIPVKVHLGAVINFEAGSVARAPAFFRRSGLEWLWRIKEEPQLARRYWMDAKTLGFLLMKGVLPERRSRAGEDLLEIAVESAGPSHHLVLKGSVTDAAVPELSRSFSAALASGGDVTLDLQQVARFDPAGLGQMALLAKALSEQGRELALINLAPRWRNYFMLWQLDRSLGGID